MLFYVNKIIAIFIRKLKIVVNIWSITKYKGGGNPLEQIYIFTHIFSVNIIIFLNKLFYRWLFSKFAGRKIILNLIFNYMS